MNRELSQGLSLLLSSSLALLPVLSFLCLLPVLDDVRHMFKGAQGAQHLPVNIPQLQGCLTVIITVVSISYYTLPDRRGRVAPEMGGPINQQQTSGRVL